MKNRISILLVFAIVVIMTLSACGVVGEITAVSDAGKAFMTALRDADHATSWNMLTSDVQTEIGSEPAWVEFATPRNFSEWKFSETNVENDTAQIDGEATLGADTYTLRLVLDKVDEEWKISGISVTLKQ
jgi:hypothetical protein